MRRRYSKRRVRGEGWKSVLLLRWQKPPAGYRLEWRNRLGWVYVRVETLYKFPYELTEDNYVR